MPESLQCTSHQRPQQFADAPLKGLPLPSNFQTLAMANAPANAQGLALVQHEEGQGGAPVSATWRSCRSLPSPKLILFLFEFYGGDGGGACVRMIGVEDSVRVAAGWMKVIGYKIDQDSSVCLGNLLMK